MGTRKIMNLKQIAQAYGADYRTFKRDMENRSGIYDELEDAGFDGSKFYPIHQQIVEDYFGPIPEPKKRS